MTMRMSTLSIVVLLPSLLLWLVAHGHPAILPDSGQELSSENLLPDDTTPPIKSATRKTKVLQIVDAVVTEQQDPSAGIRIARNESSQLPPLLLQLIGNSNRKAKLVAQDLKISRQANIALGQSLALVVNLILALPLVLVNAVAFLLRTTLPIVNAIIVQTPIVVFNLLARILGGVGQTAVFLVRDVLLQLVAVVVRLAFIRMPVLLFNAVSLVAATLANSVAFVFQAVVVQAPQLLAGILAAAVRGLFVQVPTLLINLLSPLVTGLVAVINSVLQAVLISFPRLVINFLAPIWIGLGNVIVTLVQVSRDTQLLKYRNSLVCTQGYLFQIA